LQHLLQRPIIYAEVRLFDRFYFEAGELELDRSPEVAQVR